MADLQKDELAVYDRQLRLWGVEAQKKFRFAFLTLFCCFQWEKQPTLIG